MDNAFTGAALDRAGDSRRRDQAWLDEQRAHPGARAVVAGDRGLRIVDGHLELVPLAELNGAEPLLLGLDEHGPLFAVDEDPLREGRVPMVGSGGVRGEPPAGSGDERLSLRQAAAVLPHAEGGLVAYAAALLNWHRRHRFCSACGRESDLVEGGLTRLCPHCGAEHHPRTDPVVIMLVTDGDRLMLGRQASWPERPLLGAGRLRRARRGARGGGRARGLGGVGRRASAGRVMSTRSPGPSPPR